MVTLRCCRSGSASSWRAEQTALTLRRPALFSPQRRSAHHRNPVARILQTNGRSRGRKVPGLSRYRRAPGRRPAIGRGHVDRLRALDFKRGIRDEQTRVRGRAGSDSRRRGLRVALVSGHADGASDARRGEQDGDQRAVPAERDLHALRPRMAFVYRGDEANAESRAERLLGRAARDLATATAGSWLGTRTLGAAMEWGDQDYPRSLLRRPARIDRRQRGRIRRQPQDYVPLAGFQPATASSARREAHLGRHGRNDFGGSRQATGG